MGTEAERQDCRKAMAFDLCNIIDEDPAQETYTKKRQDFPLNIKSLRILSKFRGVLFSISLIIYSRTNNFKNILTFVVL